MSSLNTKNGYLAKDEDFKFTESVWGTDGYDVLGKGKGYFQYIGESKVVEIPYIIQGHPMTSYYKMFEGTDVKEVISTNKNINNMSCMFQHIKTNSLDLYKFDTSNVINMSYMFHNVSIRKLDLYSFNTESVITMKGMFYGSKIKRLNISNFNTKKVTDMSSMFCDSNILNLDLSSFDTSNVTDMNSMFRNSSAVSIVFSENFNTLNVVNINSMFGDSNTKVLDLSSFDTSNIEDMFIMFNGSNATIGYARTQEDADRFNKVGGKPKNLTFIVKTKDK